MLSTLVSVDDNALEIHKQNTPSSQYNSQGGFSSFSGPRSLAKIIGLGIGFILILLILYAYQK